MHGKRGVRVEVYEWRGAGMWGVREGVYEWRGTGLRGVRERVYEWRGARVEECWQGTRGGAQEGGCTEEGPFVAAVGATILRCTEWGTRQDL